MILGVVGRLFNAFLRILGLHRPPSPPAPPPPPSPYAGFEDFILGGRWIDVQYSTNVDAIRYDAEQMILYVNYKVNRIYAYWFVNVNDALAFAQSISKGRWVWDHLRGRLDIIASHYRRIH